MSRFNFRTKWRNYGRYFSGFIFFERLSGHLFIVFKCQWYWGGINCTKAIKLLRKCDVGTFLVRDSHSDNSLFTISYKAPKKIYHTRISRHRGRYCLGGPNALIHSASIIDIIEQTIQSSSDKHHRYSILMQPTEVDPTTQFVELRYPLGRNQFLGSLKYWCRIAIRRQILDVGLIERLQLPHHLKTYLADSGYAAIFWLFLIASTHLFS